MRTGGIFKIEGQASFIDAMTFDQKPEGDEREIHS